MDPSPFYDFRLYLAYTMNDPIPPQKQPRPTLGELFELSLTALVNAPGVFASLAARPAPSAGSLLLLALAWGGAFFALNLIHVALMNPASLQFYAPATIATVSVLGLGAWAALYLLASSLLYGLGRALGAAGDFNGALLVAAVTLAAAPVLGLCNWFATAWVVPTIIAGWMAACGLNALFKTNAWSARAACAALVAGALVVQYGVREFTLKTTSAAQLAKSAVTAGSELAGQLAPGPARSGLDLLRVPADAEATSAPSRQRLQQTMAVGDAMNSSVLGMLDALSPMLSNPAITQHMNPQQKADFVELRKIISELKASIASGVVITPIEQRRRMTRVQQLALRMMNAGLSMGREPAAKAKR